MHIRFGARATLVAVKLQGAPRRESFGGGGGGGGRRGGGGGYDDGGYGGGSYGVSSLSALLAHI